MDKPRTWVEVIDPASGRKVDVTIAWHSGWEDGAENLDDLAGIVIDALGKYGAYLSDVEYADTPPRTMLTNPTLGVSHGLTHDETAACAEYGCVPA